MGKEDEPKKLEELKKKAKREKDDVATDADNNINDHNNDDEDEGEEDELNGNGDDDEGEDEESVAAEPLATTRSRRANAGNLMGLMIQEEDDDFYKNQYGGFYDEDDDEDFESDAEDGNDEASDSDDSSDSSSSEDDEDDEKIGLKEESQTRTKKRRGSTQNDRATQQLDLNQPTSPSRKAFDSCKKICSVCLGDQSGEDDEIIECDACGVSVHESCYGVTDDHENASDKVSVQSNISSESTETWFCEPCKRSVRHPNCELCPNLGGIFKQTDTGRWVHMVCALYTRGVTFENTDNLSDVSLFELNYSLYGSKTCALCEDRRLARSGICIGCDAGLCKTFFHATCAQKEGLLFELQSDEIDHYIAQCMQHADKDVVKKKKRLCTALFARLKRIEPLESCSQQTKEKLSKLTQQPDPHLSRWTPKKPPPIPPRVSRMLMTSSSLINRLNKKSELMGLDTKSPFMSVQDEAEMARQKWHITPAFSLEFVAYCIDRKTRMSNMLKQNKELVHQNMMLKREETSLRDKYNSIKEKVRKAETENDALIKEFRAIQKSVAATTGKPFNLTHSVEQLIARSSNVKNRNFVKASKHANKTSSTYNCDKCKTVKDQHLLALCDTCNCYFHIYCLDPPLTRVPKKTKFGGWQCSDCSEKDEEMEEEALEEQNIQAIQEADGPRRLREQIKFPEKYCHESMMLADFWSTHKKKSKKSSKSSGSKSKKIKIER